MSQDLKDLQELIYNIENSEKSPEVIDYMK